MPAILQETEHPIIVEYVNEKVELVQAGKQIILEPDNIKELIEWLETLQKFF